MQLSLNSKICVAATALAILSLGVTAAVIGYNWLVRGNNVTLAQLNAFAHELLTFLSTGSTLADNGRDRGAEAGAVRALRPAAA